MCIITNIFVLHVVYQVAGIFSLGIVLRLLTGKGIAKATKQVANSLRRLLRDIPAIRHEKVGDLVKAHESECYDVLELYVVWGLAAVGTTHIAFVLQTSRQFSQRARREQSACWMTSLTVEGRCLPLGASRVAACYGPSTYQLTHSLTLSSIVFCPPLCPRRRRNSQSYRAEA